MARGGSSADDIAKAILERLLESRKPVVSAIKNVADDAGSLANKASSVVSKAFKKGKAKPKVTSKSAGKVTPKPSKSASKPMTKAERRLANQRADAERRATGSDERAAKKAAQKKANREKYLNKEKSKIEMRMTPQVMRQKGYPIITNTLTKKMNSVDFKTRMLKNEGGMLDKEVNEQTYRLVKLYQQDGRKLTVKQVKTLRNNVKAEIKSFAERNLDTLSRGVETRIKNLGKMTPQELDTEAGRLAFRNKKIKIKKGADPVDSRRDYQVRQDKELNMRIEALERKRADAKRNRGTGTPTGPREKGPESAKAKAARLSAAESEAKLAKAQAENAKKSVERKPILHSTANRYTWEELKNVRLNTAEESAEKAKLLNKEWEGGSSRITPPPVERNAFGMTREEFAVYKANLEKAAKNKGSKTPKRK